MRKSPYLSAGLRNLCSYAGRESLRGSCGFSPTSSCLMYCILLSIAAEFYDAKSAQSPLFNAVRFAID